jgi:RNA recognition motif-containing protein
MKLWIGNLDPKTTDDELREFLKKYTKLTITGIVRHPGDGSRPAVMLELEGGFRSGRGGRQGRQARQPHLDAAQRRLHGMYWKNRPLHVAIPSR